MHGSLDLSCRAPGLTSGCGAFTWARHSMNVGVSLRHLTLTPDREPSAASAHARPADSAPHLAGQVDGFDGDFRPLHRRMRHRLSMTAATSTATPAIPSSQ